MRQYRSVFALGLGVEEQTSVHPDDPARRCKGVELRAVDQDEFQASVSDLAGLDQSVNAGFHVILELRIVELRNLTAQHCQPGAAELVFLLRRDNGRTGVAE
ncbi:hypothetical protein D3C73_1471980 [compost metagenome]